MAEASHDEPRGRRIHLQDEFLFFEDLLKIGLSSLVGLQLLEIDVRVRTPVGFLVALGIGNP